MKKKLLIVGASNKLGGIEMFVYNQVKVMHKDLDITLLSFSPDFCFKEDYKKMKVKIVTLPMRRNGYKSFIKSLITFFKNNKYDIVHFNMMSYSFFEPIILAKKYNKNAKIILHSHIAGAVTDANKVFNILGKIFIKSSNKYGRIACSKLAGKFLFGNKNFAVVNNKIDLKKFEFSEDMRKEYRKEFNISDDEILLGNIGRFSIQKNHTYLIDVFRKVCDQRNNYKLILCGGGELQEEIREKVHLCHLNDKVIFAGVRNDISNILQAMDVFVFPSLFEGLPITVLEAQGSGIPAIISDTITDEVIYNGNVEQCGIDEKDIDKWSEKIINISSARAKISKRLIEEYDLANGMKELMRIYQE